MNGNELLDKMSLIDPMYIEAAEQAVPRKNKIWMKWAALAACFCLIVGMVHMVPLWQDTPGTVTSVPGADVTTAWRDEQDIHLSATDILVDWYYEYIGQGELVYNEAVTIVSADRSYIPGYFIKELTAHEIAAVVPEKVMANMSILGFAGFDGTGKLLDVILEIDTSFLGRGAQLIYRNGEPSSGYVLTEEPTVSICNGMDVTVYQWLKDETECILDAYGQINGWSMQFVCEVGVDELEQVKHDFEILIRCLSDFRGGTPNFSVIVAEEIPEFFDIKLTLNEAQNDSKFGEYMVQSIPEGFASESIRRYKDQTQEYLGGLWSNGLAELGWIISEYDETDSERLTSIVDVENYDLSLYPIPRAESVPEELHEIVNCPIFNADELTLDVVYKRAYKVDDAGDIEGWRMMFAVKFDNVIVELRTKGVEPEWVFQQIKYILEK